MPKNLISSGVLPFLQIQTVNEKRSIKWQFRHTYGLKMTAVQILGALLMYSNARAVSRCWDSVMGYICQQIT